MNLSQVGMLLEIVGFALAAVFAGILLERGVLGVWRGKIEAIFSRMATALDRITFSWGREGTYGFPGTDKLSSLGTRTFGSMLFWSLVLSSPSVGIACTIAGLMLGVWGLFWAGIGAFCLFVVGVMTVVFMIRRRAAPAEASSEYLPRGVPENGKSNEEDTSSNEVRGLLVIPFFLLVMALFLVFSITAIPLCLLLGGIRSLQLVIVLLVGQDTLKKVLIIIGTSLLLMGLIIEFVSTM